MSHPIREAVPMKIKMFPLASVRVEVIARFGEARLVQRMDGRHELVGGTRSDHQAALEWCSLFHHDLVFSRSGARRASTPLPDSYLRRSVA